MEALRIEGIYKQYRLGEISTGTVSHDLNRWWAKLRGKEDPYKKITEPSGLPNNDNNAYVWALENINFSMQQGDVLGIIGKNGAGKSTLLKILAKVTSPTKGCVKINGRIASLLEVGTGFHPELTGRENIFLNGAILGMSKREIHSKFDEIVAFSGVEKYIDTPVKRYSSGMYVRLAFAVAAHLEPEILIIDEVLAVGDAEFQRKCLGKMKEVAGAGRTVLFVSHNMAAVKKLCNKGLLLEQGRILFYGSAEDSVQEYYRINEGSATRHVSYDNTLHAPGSKGIFVKKIALTPTLPYMDDIITVEFEFFNESPRERIAVAFDVLHRDEFVVFGSGAILKSQDAIVRGSCIFPKDLLNEGFYSINLYVNTEDYQPIFAQPQVLTFEILERERDYSYFGKVQGVIRPKLTWLTP
jgi:lipopolysaccharide transport system ATP-binding protein